MSTCTARSVSFSTSNSTASSMQQQQPHQESKWTTTLRSTPQDVPPKAKATRIKIARKKKLKEPLPDFDDKTVPIHEVVEDVLKYMKKKEKVVAKINGKKSAKLSEKQDMDEVKNRIVQIEHTMAMQFGQVEQNMNILKELFDDMKRTNEIRNAKWDADLSSCIANMETKSEKEKSKVVATLQKIHKEHSSDKKETQEHLKKVEQHAKKTTQSIVNGMQKISEDLSHTKYDVDMLMKKRIGIVIGGDASAGVGAGAGPTAPPSSSIKQNLDTSFSGFCSVDEGVDLLGQRMSQLDHRIAHIEQHDLAQRTAAARGGGRAGGRGGVFRGYTQHRYQGEEDSVDSLEQERVREAGGVTSYAYVELEGRVAKMEAAVVRMKRMASGGGEKRRHNQNQREEERGEEEEIEKVQGQIRSLQRKLKTLGDSTSRACRSLSVGVTDAQNASLQLFSWADKVHMAFEHVSKDCLHLSKNILPRAKLMELSNTTHSSPTSASKEKNSRSSSRGRSSKRRSVSAGGDAQRRTRSQEQSGGHGDVDSDYEIKF